METTSPHNNNVSLAILKVKLVTWIHHALSGKTLASVVNVSKSKGKSHIAKTINFYNVVRRHSVFSLHIQGSPQRKFSQKASHKTFHY